MRLSTLGSLIGGVLILLHECYCFSLFVFSKYFAPLVARHIAAIAWKVQALIYLVLDRCSVHNYVNMPSHPHGRCAEWWQEVTYHKYTATTAMKPCLKTIQGLRWVMLLIVFDFATNFFQHTSF